MVIIDFTDTKRQAFVRGFYKGFTAPSMLFEQYSAPPLPEVKQISPPSINEEQALNSDWEKIGADFMHVIVTYGSETTTEKQ
jgi:hypothetical protein